ncbi:MAG TPA: hypothetical protein VM490_16630 [Armatimonadaceae bacterium]|jgi:hypothetical protein|nr:hypothetical protein [Armatimonadaceae bacterium]
MKLLLFPFRVLGVLIVLLGIPAGVAALAAWIFGTGSLPFLLIALGSLVWAAASLHLWNRQNLAHGHRMSRRPRW